MEMVALGGYLKSTKGRGGVLVADRDRTSLHLDLIARDRGLKRYPGSRRIDSGVVGGILSQSQGGHPHATLCDTTAIHAAGRCKD